MREFELVIDEALRNGLSPFRSTPFNTPLLKECLGYRLGDMGLDEYRIKGHPLSVDLCYNWPFPQVISGENYDILVIRDTSELKGDVVYSIRYIHSNESFIALIPFSQYGTGTLMEVADFGKYIFMTNGAAMIYRDPTTNLWVKMSSSTAAVPRLRTICNFKGQLVGGHVVDVWHDCDDKFYVWSKIGQVDFTPDEYNLAGYRRDPFGGEVYHVRRLGDDCIGYSAEGITLIKPVSEPAPTFGFYELSNIGLRNRGAIGGDLNRQVYVGEDNILREVTKQGVKELGYEYFLNKITEDIIVTYDRKYGDFYIGDSNKTFLLTSKGLTEIPQHPSAVWRRDGETYMLPSTTNTYQPLIVTQPFDMGYPGQKTIFEVETDLLATDGEVAIDYYTNPTSYGTTPYIPLNHQNIATTIASGNIFSIRLRCSSDYNGIKVGYIKVRYKMTDLRGIRGMFAMPQGGQN